LETIICPNLKEYFTADFHDKNCSELLRKDLGKHLQNVCHYRKVVCQYCKVEEKAYWLEALYPASRILTNALINVVKTTFLVKMCQLIVRSAHCRQYRVRFKKLAVVWSYLDNRWTSIWLIIKPLIWYTPTIHATSKHNRSLLGV